MVIGFLVLSGFLLGTMFNRVQALDVTQFYVGKARRLLPMFLAALLAGVCISAIHAGWGHILPPWSSHEWGHCHLSEWLAHYDSPLWYMVVEFSMLLLAPFLFFLHKRKCGMVCFFILAIAVAAIMFSQVDYLSNRGDGLYYSPVARCWQFVGGVFAARLPEWGCLALPKRQTLCRSCAIILSLAFLAALAFLMSVEQEAELHCWNFTFEFDTLSVLLYMLLIPALYSCRMVVGQHTARMFAQIAAMTYPIYLFHVEVWIVVLALQARMGMDFPAYMPTITAAILSCLLAWLLVKVESRVSARFK